MSKDLTACEEFMELITIHVMTAMGGDLCHHMHKTNSLATICGDLPPAFVLCVCVCVVVQITSHTTAELPARIFSNDAIETLVIGTTVYSC